ARLVIDPRAALALELDQPRQRFRSARPRAQPDPAGDALAAQPAARPQLSPRRTAVFHLPIRERANDRSSILHSTVKTASAHAIPGLRLLRIAEHRSVVRLAVSRP